MGPDMVSPVALEMEPFVSISGRDDSLERQDSTDTQRVASPQGTDFPNTQRLDMSTDETDLGLTRNQIANHSQRNEFSNRKQVAKCLVDFALFAANISQLRILLSHTPEAVPFYYVLLSLVICSLIGQCVFAFIILAVWERESRRDNKSSSGQGELGDEKEVTEQSDSVVETLNLVSVIIVFLITILNVCITGLGITTIDKLPNSTRTL